MSKSFHIAQEQAFSGRINLIHQCTFHSYREPGDFWRLPVPSVWAPVAGVSNVPWSMLPALGTVEGARLGFRNVVNTGHKFLNQRFRNAVRGYSRVVAGSDEAAQLFRKFRHDIDVIPGQLVRSNHSDCHSDDGSAGPALRLIFCGQHFSRKGGGFLIQAFAKAVQSCNVQLTMVGEGFMTQKWKDLASKLGCQERIIWTGRVTRTEVFQWLQQSDVFVFPSLNDCYPTVIAEAFTMGLPVITTDIPGVGDMVDEHSGYLLRADSASGLVQRLADTIVHLANNPGELQRLRAGVIKRRQEFLFEQRMQRLLEIYEELLSGR